MARPAPTTSPPGQHYLGTCNHDQRHRPQPPLSLGATDLRAQRCQPPNCSRQRAPRKIVRAPPQLSEPVTDAWRMCAPAALASELGESGDHPDPEPASTAPLPKTRGATDGRRNTRSALVTAKADPWASDQIGGSARFAQVEGPITLCERTWRVAGFPALDAIRCPDLRSTSSADQPDLRGWRRSRTGSACATRADVQRGSWTSSLGRVPQVSDAIRCRDDIRAVQF